VCGLDWNVSKYYPAKVFSLTTVTSYCPATRRWPSVGHPIISAFSSSHSWPQRLI